MIPSTPPSLLQIRHPCKRLDSRLRGNDKEKCGKDLHPEKQRHACVGKHTDKGAGFESLPGTSSEPDDIIVGAIGNIKIVADDRDSIRLGELAGIEGAASFSE